MNGTGYVTITNYDGVQMADKTVDVEWRTDFRDGRFNLAFSPPNANADVTVDFTITTYGYVGIAVFDTELGLVGVFDMRRMAKGDALSVTMPPVNGYATCPTCGQEMP